MCIRAGGPWALAGAVAVSLPAAFTPAVTGQCNNPDPSPDCADAQIGITGDFVQECDAFGGSDDPNTPEAGDGWTGLAFPFQTGGANVGAITFTLNTNRAGGDVWILGNTDAPSDCPEDCQEFPSGAVDVPDLLALLGAWGGPQTPGTTCDLSGSGIIDVPDLLQLLVAWGPCPPPTACGQPDITNVLAQVCCGLEALAADVVHTINFGSVATSAVEPTWVVFVGRTGLAGMNDIDNDGTANHFNGSTFPSHQVARECQIDVNGDCLAPSSPNQAFANFSAAGVGAPGEWTDLHDLGGGLGTPYCVSLIPSVLNDGTDCWNNFAVSGMCCVGGPPFPHCIIATSWQCGIDDGIYGGDNTICFFHEKCMCGPGVGSCLVERLGQAGCELMSCCEVVCTNDFACCSFEWDQVCADSAAANPVACLGDLESPDPTTIATGADDTQEPWLSISPDVYGSFMVDFVGYASPPDPENDDHYNPVGPHAIVFDPVTGEYEPAGPTFSTGFMFFTGGIGREVLTANSGWLDNAGRTGRAPISRSVFDSFNDTSMVKQVLTAHVASDTNGDLVNDTLTGGSFRVLLLAAFSSVDITIAVTQSVQIIGGLAVYDLTYTLTNNSVDGGGVPIAVTFELMRQYDGNHLYVGDHTNDQVGTTWNAVGGAAGRFVVLREPGDSQTAYTMSSPDADAYSGGKSGDEPGGGGFIHSCGTCGVVFGNFGLPAPWADNISDVGTLTDGFSTTANDPADAGTYLRIPVSMAASEAGLTISLRVTYGDAVPAP